MLKTNLVSMSSLPRRIVLLVVVAVIGSTSALALADPFIPGDLIMTRSVYTGTASTVTIGQTLPPICGTQATCNGKATDNGQFPNLLNSNNVWNNDKVDGSFAFEVQVSSDPAALLDLFHQQRAALAARVKVTPVPGLGTEAFQYVAVGQNGLSLDIYDDNLIMRLSWTAKRLGDKPPADLAEALAGTCRSTLRLLRQV